MKELEGRYRVKRKELVDLLINKGMSRITAYRKVKKLLRERKLYTDGSYIFCEPVKAEVIKQW